MQVKHALVATALGALGCGTDAVGVSACRDIEQARCEAGVACGYPDVIACRRFYRDHCLHGLSVEEVLEVDVQSCVASIEAAGRCADAQGVETAPAECSEAVGATSAATVCDVVDRPEAATACAFLVPPEPVVAPAAEQASGDGG